MREHTCPAIMALREKVESIPAGAKRAEYLFKMMQHCKYMESNNLREFTFRCSDREIDFQPRLEVWEKCSQ